VHLYCLPLKFILRYGVSRFFSGSRCIKTTYTVRVNSHTVFIGGNNDTVVASSAALLRYVMRSLYTTSANRSVHATSYIHTRTHTAAARTYHRDLLHYIYVYIYRVNIHTTKTYLWYTLTDVNCSARTRWTNHSLPNNARAPAEQVSKQVPEIIKKSNRTPGDGPVRAGVSALRRNSNERTTFQVSRMVHGAR